MDPVRTTILGRALRHAKNLHVANDGAACILGRIGLSPKDGWYRKSLARQRSRALPGFSFSRRP